MEKYLKLYDGGEGPSLWLTLREAGSMGQSDDRENPARLRAFNDFGIKAEAVHTVCQMHTRTVVEACAETLSERQLEADGILSRDGKDILAVTVADCLPLLLHDVRTGAYALLHSGWKGTGIALEALRMMMRSCGTRREDVTAVLGPSIRSCCYKVDAERAEVFAAEWGERSISEKGGEFFLSLQAANEAMLEKAGVGRVLDCNECTCCNTRFGSFRRQGAGNFSRMIAFTTLNPSA